MSESVATTSVSKAEADAIEPADLDDSLRPVLFYDGHCGLCHNSVKYALKHDKNGHLLIAPLRGELFEKLISAEDQARLPDSVVLREPDGTLLTHTTAVVGVLRHLGGRQKLYAGILKFFPRVLRDFGYNLVARLRHRLFSTPEQACPMMPDHLRQRFRS